MNRRFAYLAGRCRFAIAAFIWILAVVDLAYAEDVPSGDQRTAARGKPIAFDISRRSLDDALAAYGEKTRYTALVDSERTAGRRSGSATGVLTPERALSEVLDGTGLVAHFSTPTAFTLMPAPQMGPSRSGTNPAPQHANYFVAIQSTIRRVLCSRQDTRPGSYRAALQIWIDGRGSIERSELLSPTDSEDRDAKIKMSLLNAAVGGLPPAGLPQPVTVVLTLRAANSAAECEGVRAELR